MALSSAFLKHIEFEVFSLFSLFELVLKQSTEFGLDCHQMGQNYSYLLDMNNYGPNKFFFTTKESVCETMQTFNQGSQLTVCLSTFKVNFEKKK